MAATKVYTVRAPNGKVYQITGPANASPQQLQNAILKAHPEAKGTGRAPLEGALGKLETAGMGLTRGIDEALFGTVRLLGKGFELIGAEDIGRGMQRYAGRELDKSTAAYEPFLRKNPITAESGRIGGNIAGLAIPGKVATLPLKALSRVAPALAPVATALETGGLSTGVTATRVAAKEAPLVAKAVDAALRVGAGATAGVASSAALGQDVEEGGAVGASIAMIPLIGRYGVAPVWNALRGRVGEARAARIFREALGANYEAARNAFTKTSGDARRTASQILARMGVDADQFFATGKVVARQGDTTGVLDDIERGQQASQLATLNAAAGGADRTASRQAAATQRRGTTETATPIMQQTLGDVNVNTQNALAAQRAAAQGRQIAATETQTAKRLLAAGERRGALAEAIGGLTPDEMPMGIIQKIRGQAGALEQRGAQAAERGLAAGADARTAEQRLANLREAGVEPLDASALSARFRQMGAAESANPERAALFEGFADEVDRLAAENNGILDAFDLYEIRKDAGQFVERMLQGRAPNAVRRRTAEVVGAVRPEIDKAFKAAGGERWSEYLDTFSTGMDEAKRIDFSDYARALYEKSPEEFQRLMAGNRPEIVERFFGKGRYDVNEVLGPKSVNMPGPTRRGEILTGTPQGPSRLPAMQGVAADVADDIRIQNAMTPGATARAENALKPSPNVMVRLGKALPFQAGGLIEQPARYYDEARNAAVIRALEKGFSSPQSALNLMNYRPSGEKLFIGLQNLPADVQLALQQLGVQLGREEPNYMTMIK